MSRTFVFGEEEFVKMVGEHFNIERGSYLPHISIDQGKDKVIVFKVRFEKVQ